MGDRHQRGVEAQINEAMRRGQFDQLPGAGKPLPNRGQPLSEDWWVREKVAREQIGFDNLPTTLRLAKQLEELEPTIDKFRTVSKVRQWLEELNDEIKRAQLGPVDGPPRTLRQVNIEETVQQWRERRQK